MKEFSYVITDASGIHARPAGQLVQEAGKFTSNLTMHKNDKSGDMKRIFAVMGLGAKQGETIVVRAEGEDEDAAIAAMEAFLRANL